MINTQRKRIDWSQSIPSLEQKVLKPVKLKKSLQYILLLKKFNNIINYKNIKLLKAFITKSGKIRPRRKTRITIQQQHLISKAIRKARNLGLIPFTCDIII